MESILSMALGLGDEASYTVTVAFMLVLLSKAHSFAVAWPLSVQLTKP